MRACYDLNHCIIYGRNCRTQSIRQNYVNVIGSPECDPKDEIEMECAKVKTVGGEREQNKTGMPA
jgi:hypothetical protein